MLARGHIAFEQTFLFALNFFVDLIREGFQCANHAILSKSKQGLGIGIDICKVRLVPVFCIVSFHNGADRVQLGGKVNALFILQHSSGLIFVGLCANRIFQLLRVELHVGHSLDFCTLQVANGGHALRFTEHNSRVICKCILDKCEFRQQFCTFGSLKKHQEVVQLPIDFCQLGADIRKEILPGGKGSNAEHLKSCNRYGIDLIQRCSACKVSGGIYHSCRLTALM